jgi:hypothetical protein
MTLSQTSGSWCGVVITAYGVIITSFIFILDLLGSVDHFELIETTATLDQHQHAIISSHASVIFINFTY